MLTWTLQAVSPSTVLFSLENTLFLDATEPQQESIILVASVMALRCKFGALRSAGERSVAERGLSYAASSSSDFCSAGICLGPDKRPGSRPSDALPSGTDLDHVCVDRENNRVQTGETPAGAGCATRPGSNAPPQPRAATKATLSLTRPADPYKASSRRSADPYKSSIDTKTMSVRDLCHPPIPKTHHPSTHSLNPPHGQKHDTARVSHPVQRSAPPSQRIPFTAAHRAQRIASRTAQRTARASHPVQRIASQPARAPCSAPPRTNQPAAHHPPRTGGV